MSRDKDISGEAAGACGSASPVNPGRQCLDVARSWRTFGVVFLFHTALGACYAALLLWLFGYRYLSVTLHASLVALLVLSLTLLLGGLALIPAVATTRLLRLLLASIPAGVSSLVALLYAGDYVSNRLWQGNLTWDVIRVFLPDLREQLESFNLPLSYCVVGLSLPLLAVFGIYWSQATRLTACLRCMFGADEAASPKARAGTALKAFGLLGTATLLVAVAAGAELRQPDIVLARDPFAGLWVGRVLLSSAPPSPKLDAQVKQSRALYSKPLPHVPRHVIVILVDSLRADHLSLYGYNRETAPFLASLYSQGRLRKVDYAVSNSNESASSVLSLLCGRSFGHLSADNFTLLEALKRQGYDTYFIGSGDHTRFLGPQYTSILRAYTDRYCDGTQFAGKSISDDLLLFEHLAQIPSAGSRPAFFYFHLMSAHTGGTRHPEFRKWLPERTDASPLLVGDYVVDAEAVQAVNRYDNGILQADEMIRRIFLALDEKGYLSQAFVTVVADHGEGFGEHQHAGHGWYLYAEDTRIPFLILDESDRPYPPLPFGTILDAAPTIADALGFPLPPCWEGVSLFRGVKERYAYQTSAFSPYRYSVLYRTEAGRLYKYMAAPGDSDEVYTEEALYELSSDPRELNNLVQHAEAPAALLRRRAAVWTGFYYPEK